MTRCFKLLCVLLLVHLHLPVYQNVRKESEDGEYESELDETSNSSDLKNSSSSMQPVAGNDSIMKPSQYPFALYIVIIVAIPFCVDRLAAIIGLPGHAFLILCGYCMSGYIEHDFSLVQTWLVEMSLLSILIMGSLSVPVHQLTVNVIASAILPALFELGAIWATACRFLGFECIEGLTLGIVLVPVADGLVISKLRNLTETHFMNRMPTVMLAASPVQVVFFIILAGFVEPFNITKTADERSRQRALLEILESVFFTSVVGFLTGYLCSQLIVFCQSFKVGGKHLFSASRGDLLVIFGGFCLLLFGCAETAPDGRRFLRVPVLFLPGVIFIERELVVVVFSLSFSYFSEAALANHVLKAVRQLWVIGKLVAFMMIGCSSEFRTSFGYWKDFLILAPLSLCTRFAGEFWVALLDAGSAHVADCTMDASFCTLVNIPRGTIQALLAMDIVARRRLSDASQAVRDAGSEIFGCAMWYVFVFSTFGYVAFNHYSTKLLSMPHRDET